MASTSNQFSASSLSPLWDVFLSFHGNDTRRNFIASLYFALDQAGFPTFRDDPALQKGQGISLGLLEAIKHSKMFVVVLSENYACSSWCLDELVEILNCKKLENHVVPVFYYVDPSDLRHRKGSFGEALEGHKKRQSVDTIEKWRSALAEIAGLSGYHLKNADENESDTIQEIVENVARQTPAKILYLEEYLFGINSVVEEIYQKLRMESNVFRVIGICGMGGIGKTTTTKAFYNKYSSKFDITCFMENIKQSSQRGSPLLPLLEQLLIQFLRRKDYKVPDVESGIRQLRQILCSKSALIVLDDLDQSSHLELLVRLCNLFSVGSRLIITSRDVNVLNQLKVDISEVDVYMVKELGKKESLKLFSYHAFRKTMPPENLIELSVKFVNYVGGLPLALKVSGSSLRGRTDVSFWEAQLEKVRVNPEIHYILKLSYDELGDKTEKAIFLDIVFFFIGKDKDEAAHVFKSSKFHPEAGIPILVERCLLTVDKNNTFRMHNLIEDMGRKVIREEFKYGKCTHLYLCHENACQVLQNFEVTQRLECLILDLTLATKKHLDAKIFEKMPNLRLREIIDAHDIKGNFKNSFSELRCIRWSDCSWSNLPSSFRPPQLVAIDMPFSNFKKLWKGSMPLPSLKTINVFYSKNLKTIPRFRDIKFVEKLLLGGCERLLKVHPSLGQLSNLGHLDLANCSLLKGLPEEIGKLTKLVHLDLGRCYNLKKLPESIKQLANLVYLNLCYCRKLKQLPDQLGDMKALKVLDASHTAIELLPNSVAHLMELVGLQLKGCTKLKRLPEQIGNMEGSREFDVSFSGIEELPESIVNLKELVELEMRHCTELRKLPEQIGNMEGLRNLDASFSRIEELPDSISRMKGLVSMRLLYCKNLRKLPDSFGGLINLVNLELSNCTNLTSLPNSICNLKLLKVLYLICCLKLEQLPEQIGKMRSLEKLDASCTPIVELPDSVGLLSRLQYLALGAYGGKSCSHNNCIGNFTSPARFWHPKNFLPIDHLSKLSYLQNLPMGTWSSFPHLPPNLVKLEVSNYATLEKLSDISGFKLLNSLSIINCIKLQSLPQLPPHLEKLKVCECPSLQEDLLDLSMLKELIDVRITECRHLKSVRLNESCLQVGRSRYYKFEADIPHRKIAEWFSYKSSGDTLSFDISPELGDNFLGVALWAVYECKNSRSHSGFITMVIENKTEGLADNFYYWVGFDRVDEVSSMVRCIWRENIAMKSGDKIKVSFQRTVDHCCGIVVQRQPSKLVIMCGAHIIRKIP